MDIRINSSTDPMMDAVILDSDCYVCGNAFGNIVDVYKATGCQHAFCSDCLPACMLYTYNANKTQPIRMMVNGICPICVYLKVKRNLKGN